MNSPFRKKNTSFDMNNKKPLVKEFSSFSSNLLTDSSSRISVSELKRINLFKYSLKAKNLKNSRNNLKMPKIKIKTNIINSRNNNFLYSFTKKRKSEEKILNLSKISRNNNTNCSELYNGNYSESNFNNTDININIDIKEPLYKFFNSRKDSILNFKYQTRKIRLLKIDSYNGKKALDGLKQNLLYNEDKTKLFEFNKSEEKHLINIFYESLFSYLTFLKRKINKDVIINETLLEKKNILIQNIMTLRNKIDKMMRKIESYLESKFFLICVKECSIDFKKFSKESKLDILYDLYKLYNYKKRIHNEFFDIDEYNDEKLNIQKFKDWLNENGKNLRNKEGLKKSTYFNYVFISIDINDYNIFNCFNKDYVKSHKIKNIFESLEDFNKVLQSDSLYIRLSLDNYILTNSDLVESKKELIYEKLRKNKLKEIFNKSKDKFNNFTQKLDIAKSNYLYNSYDNEIQKSFLINKKIKNTDKINNKLNMIINNIIKCDAEKINEIKFERRDKKITTIEDKLRYIEKIINFLINYKIEQKKYNKIIYEDVMKILKKEFFIRKFKNKEATMKKIQEMKIKKILDKKDKIFFLNHRK
jgi:hypothetical protein